MCACLHNEVSNSKYLMYNVDFSLCIITEEKMYAKMWQEDIDAKCKREEMEEAQKIERNRQMLKVHICTYYT